MKILGKVYDRLYISANGMISFDEPLRVFSELTLREMRRVALVPLYQRADLTKGGSVYVKETTDYSSLVRGSLNVQEDFHEANFQAKSIIVVTFEDVMDISATDDTVKLFSKFLEKSYRFLNRNAIPSKPLSRTATRPLMSLLSTIGS